MRRDLTRRDVISLTALAGGALVLPNLAQAHQAPAYPRAIGRPFELEEYSPRTHQAACTLADGSLILTGGSIGGRSVQDSYRFDPATGRISSIAPMSCPRAGHATVALDSGIVLVLGGISERFLDSVEAFDPQADSWNSLPSMASARANFSVCIAYNAILLIGGENETGPLGVGQYILH
jgi:N-acetylneuraminic acid mutarotase